MSFIFYQNVLSQLVIIYFKLLQIEILQLLAVHNSCHFLILFMNVVDYYCTIKYYQGRITQYNRILGFRSYYFPYVHSLYINCDLGIYFLSEFFHEFGEIVDLFIVFFIHILLLNDFWICTNGYYMFQMIIMLKLNNSN